MLATSWSTAKCLQELILVETRGHIHKSDIIPLSQSPDIWCWFCAMFNEIFDFKCFHHIVFLFFFSLIFYTESQQGWVKVPTFTYTGRDEWLSLTWYSPGMIVSVKTGMFHQLVHKVCVSSLKIKPGLESDQQLCRQVHVKRFLTGAFWIKSHLWSKKRL